jgi:hypothetical protein
VRELVEPPLGPEIVVEVLGEDERVGDQRAAGVVADEERRLVLRDVLKAADLGAEVVVAPRAQRRQRLPDVLRVARVEPVVGHCAVRDAERAGQVLDPGLDDAQRPTRRVEGTPDQSGTQHEERLPATAGGHATRQSGS